VEIIKMNKIAKWACTLTLLGMLAGCGERYFWYPVALKEVTCSSYKGELYLMKNSVGWRSWPYYLDPVDKREVELGTGCVKKTLRELPSYSDNVEYQLNEEQRKYLVDGF
jgi:hypothetical protein